MRFRSFLAALFSLGVACSAFAQGGKVCSPPTDLDSVRAAVARAHPYTESVAIVPELQLDLSGYLQHWEGDMGGGLQVMVVSRARGVRSHLLVFSRERKLVARRELGAEIHSLLPCDLDEDGILELVVDELDGWGTGILERTFRAYRISQGITQIWSSVSLSVHDPAGEEAAEEIRRGFLRCEAVGRTPPYTRLLYIEETLSRGKSTLTRVALKSQAGGIIETAWPDS